MSKGKSGIVSREYVMALRQRAHVLVGMAVLAGAVTFAVMERVPDRHEVYFSYAVSLVEREQHDEFRFDGYYALQATDLFAATLSRWVTAPEVVAAAYEEAELRLPATSGQELARVVKAEKTAPQLVQVTVRGESSQEARALAEGLREVVARQVEAYHQEGIPELVFRAVPGRQWAGMVEQKTYLAALAVGGLVLLVGLNVVGLQVALKTGHDEDSNRRARAD